ncbi:TetR/AcrR family transcriptional regulator [Vibrio sp. JC009]|uniref:TetR/AcrR family transcriptional regulator n=1 Tax=Vibrio sp. JC009 TaxID=2912314 RepID=UPI0023AF4F59|nr:TetR/AcrR family transcriptional regulator [Vibrio sp. JC009]WED24736.1 TetR/AcrR family transcriptional regulator [Vibrio sp. JC009]
MSKRSERIDQIIDETLNVLKTHGDYGVTMRKIASRCGITLSSLQYYYKTKDDLLKAVTDRYFQQIIAMIHELPEITTEEELGELLHSFLLYAFDESDMSRLFREFWAISSRNEVINKYLAGYYVSFSEIMTEKLRPISDNDEALAQAVSLLIPYIEGYPIVALSIPKGLNSTSELLKVVIWKCLKQNL